MLVDRKKNILQFIVAFIRKESHWLLYPHLHIYDINIFNWLDIHGEVFWLAHFTFFFFKVSLPIFRKLSSPPAQCQKNTCLSCRIDRCKSSDGELRESNWHKSIGEYCTTQCRQWVFWTRGEEKLSALVLMMCWNWIYKPFSCFMEPSSWWPEISL